MKYLLLALGLVIGGIAQATLPVISVNGHLLGANGKAVAIAAVTPPPVGLNVWLDPLLYQKPPDIAINEPNETTATKYWVDLASGTGTTCSQGSPCAPGGVVGKSGMLGGPAVVYIKNSGGWSWFADNVNGTGTADCRTSSCSSYILVKPWPAGSPGCVTECTATIQGNSNINSPGNIHSIIFDGGVNHNIIFLSNGSTGSYAFHILADDIWMYRTRLTCGGSNAVLGFSVGDSTPSNRVYFINGEGYGCGSTGDQISYVYAGPGSGGGYNNLTVEASIVRDFYGDGVEINPRATSDFFTFDHNAVHNNGFGTCSGGTWGCRPGLTMANQGPGAGNKDTLIYSNLIWHSGSGGIWDRGAGTPVAQIYNNTIYDYGSGVQSGGQPNPQGISGFSNGGTATIKNNNIYDPGGTNPLDGSSFTATNNLCGSGKSCGTSSQTYNAGVTFLSVNENTANYLFLGPSSTAIGAGATLAAAPTDYVLDVNTAPYDIGAINH